MLFGNVSVTDTAVVHSNCTMLRILVPQSVPTAIMSNIMFTSLQGDTALHIAVRKSSHDVEQVIRSLDGAAEVLQVRNIVSQPVC